MAQSKDQREGAMKLAQLRANQSRRGYYVYLERQKKKSGTDLVYYVVRNDMTQPKNTELIAHLAPE